MVAELNDRVARQLAAARTRTLALLDPIPESLLVAQHSALMSPLVWDLAHIGHYEELWLLRELGAGEATDARYDDIYDAFRHPRSERPTLDILGPADAREYIAGVRKRALDVLGGMALDNDDPLLADGFVYGLVIHHEHQHDETLLATVQLMDDFAHPDAADGPGASGPDPAELPLDVLVEAGPFEMGTSSDPWAYDNERPAHVVELPAFRIDTTPVTNAAYLEFIEDGGYEDPRWWTDDGWAWRTEAGLESPQFWTRTGDAWTRRRFGRVEPVPPREPVQHVCWFEADAFARWRGARLPSEAEWEKAATGATEAGGQFRLGRRFGPDEVGAHPDGASVYGCLDLLGSVWEWTASDFEAYPGFRSFPYREYSEVFFGAGRSEFGPSFKVLRGGAWATDPIACSTTFRNWDLPIRRQIFAGFRCASDA
jgi:iron(II)-dependent oxidoreductase